MEGDGVKDIDYDNNGRYITISGTFKRFSPERADLRHHTGWVLTPSDRLYVEVVCRKKSSAERKFGKKVARIVLHEKNIDMFRNQRTSLFTKAEAVKAVLDAEEEAKAANSKVHAFVGKTKETLSSLASSATSRLTTKGLKKAAAGKEGSQSLLRDDEGRY